MDNRGIDTDPGWINRQLHELRQMIEALRSERRAASSTVTDGDFTVSDGGNLFVSGTGNLYVMHEDGITPAIRLGDYTLAAFGEDATNRFSLRLREIPGVPGSASSILTATLDSFRLWTERSSGVSADSLTTNPGVTISVGSGDNLYAVGLPTTSNSANLTIDAFTGAVARSTSARKYKQDIADHDLDPTTVLKMRVRTWRDRGEVEKNPETTQRHIGFIAEELHDLGLTEFVSYDEEGRPDAVAYDRIPVALLIALRWLTKQVKDERARTDALEAKVTAQQKQIDDLAAKVAALTPPTTTTGSL